MGLGRLTGQLFAASVNGFSLITIPAFYLFVLNAFMRGTRRGTNLWSSGSVDFEWEERICVLRSLARQDHVADHAPERVTWQVLLKNCHVIAPSPTGTAGRFRIDINRELCREGYE